MQFYFNTVTSQDSFEGLLLTLVLDIIIKGLQSAPLFDSESQRFIGMLTVTDFIQLVLHYYDEKKPYDEAIAEIGQMDIAGLRRIEQNIQCLPQKTVTIDPGQSLLEASRLLIENHLHRLPLIDSSTGQSDAIVSVMTQYKILKFVAANSKRTTEMGRSVFELGIGRYSDLYTATLDTKLIDILQKLISKRISSVPIVDANGCILNVYEKYDVLMLAKAGPYYDLQVPIREALLYRSPDFEGIHSCSPSDTLGSLLDSMRSTIVHRFIVLKDNRLFGIVSLSDILAFLIRSAN